MKTKLSIKEKIEDWDMNYLTNGIVADYFYQNEARLGETLEENHSLKLKNYRIIKERIVALFSKVIEEIIGEDEFPANNKQNVNYLRTSKNAIRDELRDEQRAKLKDILKGGNGK